MAGRKTGDAWLLITSKTRPTVLDPYLATADHALGNPSWLVGRMLRATGPVGTTLLDWVYVQLAVAAVVVALYQLRTWRIERRFPRHHLVRTFLLIGLLGPGIYMIFPVVGPVFAYGSGAFGTGGEHWALANLWPGTPPPISAPHPMPYDEITPRNCMPSLHTAWATAIFIHSRRGPRALRYAGTFWLIATLTATLGFGYHYGVDLVAGVVFTLTIEAALRTLRPRLGKAGSPAGRPRRDGIRRAPAGVPLSAGGDGPAPVGVRAASPSDDGLGDLRLRTARQTLGTEGRAGAAVGTVRGTATRTGVTVEWA